MREIYYYAIFHMSVRYLVYLHAVFILCYYCPWHFFISRSHNETTTSLQSAGMIKDGGRNILRMSCLPRNEAHQLHARRVGRVKPVNECDMEVRVLATLGQPSRRRFRNALLSLLGIDFTALERYIFNGILIDCAVFRANYS